MNSNFLVSIIIPFYNAEKYIAKTIESVLNQSHTNLDIILINDGSVDKSGEIVKSYIDTRIRYFNQKNKGVSAARNVGLDNMKGAFLCFLDADDTLPPKSIESRLEVFEKFPETSFVDGNVISFDFKMNKILKSWHPTLKGKPYNDLIRLEGRSFLGLTWMIKADILGNIRFEENMTHAEDLLFLTLLAKNGGQYNFTKSTILNYRRQNESAMNNLQGLNIGYQELILALEKQCNLSKEEITFLKRKTRSIMFKSFMAKGQFGKAFNTLIKNA